MSDKPKPRRLSDVVIPGKDFAEKVKIEAVLEREVIILEIEKVSGAPEFNIVDPDTGEIVSRDYWNINVEMDDSLYTFSTGAVPIDKVLAALQRKIDNREADLPVVAVFHKQGRTYTVG